MKDFRYLPGVATLDLDQEKCIGCGECLLVCPHQVFMIADRKAAIDDRDGCMECGACAVNCKAAAITVSPGVGCASYIIKTWIKGKNAKIECC
ncbi:MAG: 4Fe-4S dicluster domain-containing protein [bacterium]|nr:4Fe-4S dicluster domain-containing protein [bacterium]